MYQAAIPWDLSPIPGSVEPEPGNETCWFGRVTKCYKPAANTLGLCEEHYRELRNA